MQNGIHFKRSPSSQLPLLLVFWLQSSASVVLKQSSQFLLCQSSMIIRVKYQFNQVNVATEFELCVSWGSCQILFSRFAYKSQWWKNVCLSLDLVLISLNWASCHIFSIVISYRRSNLRNISAEILRFHTLNTGEITALKIIFQNLNLAYLLI